MGGRVVAEYLMSDVKAFRTSIVAQSCMPRSISKGEAVTSARAAARSMHMMYHFGEGSTRGMCSAVPPLTTFFPSLKMLEMETRVVFRSAAVTSRCTMKNLPGFTRTSRYRKRPVRPRVWPLAMQEVGRRHVPRDPEHLLADHLVLRRG